jgi:hypothetical protein
MNDNGAATLPVRRNLTPQEQVAIDRVKKSNSGTGAIYKANERGEGLVLVVDEQLECGQADDLLDARIMAATGAADTTVGLHLLSNAGSAFVASKATGKELANQLNTLALTMQALTPQDEYEGQLIAQLVVLHEHAMEWLGRAKRTERVDFANVYLNGASKLLTRHHETLEALLKYRRRGEQRVHVEHVHVYGGGQAIVGNVVPRGGLSQKLEEAPHAKV